MYLIGTEKESVMETFIWYFSNFNSMGNTSKESVVVEKFCYIRSSENIPVAVVLHSFL